MATLIGTAVGDTLTGGADNDLLVGFAGGDSLTGGDGDDTLLGDAMYQPLGQTIQVVLGPVGAVSDVMLGGAGNDWIVASATDIVDGGDGNDVIDIDVSTSATSYNLNLSTLSASSAAGTAFGGIFSNIENFRFWLGSGNDVFVGSNGADVVNGGLGNDSLEGGLGNDTLFAGLGNDTLRGGDGNDELLQMQVTSLTQVGRSSSTHDSAGISILDGGAGNDLLWVYSPGSTVIGGDGIDTLVAFSYFGNTQGFNLDLSSGDVNAKVSVAFNLNVTGIESFQLYGSNFADSFIGASSVDYFFAGSGNDTVFGGAGNDTLLGGNGNDIVFGEAGADYLDGSNGDDSLISDNAGSLVGSGASQTVVAVLGSTNVDIENLFGGDGNDWFVSTGGDMVEGGVGTDTIDIDLSATTIARNFDLSSGGALAVTSLLGGTIVDVESIRLWLGSGNDTITGTSGNDIFSGGGGDDSLVGGLGNDIIYSGSGNDTISGGDGDDAIFQATIDRIAASGGFSASGGPTNSTINIDTGAGNDFVQIRSIGASVIGGTGNDVLEIIASSATTNVIDLSVNAAATIQTAFGMTVSEFETYFVVMSNGVSNDTMIGSANFDVLRGGEGNDSIEGRDGGDFLVGGTGNDILLGGNGNDSLFGESGSDLFTGGAGADSFTVIIDASGNDTITDYVAGEDILQLQGTNLTIQNNIDLDADGQLDDARITSSTGGTLTLLNAALGTTNGTAGNDSLIGSAIPDTINGFAGNDTLDGGLGNDLLDGGDGNDSLIATLGSDRLTGGLGNDTFVVATDGGTTTITDFTTGMDSIALPTLVGAVITNNIDLDADGQADDARIIYTGGTASLLNTSFGIINGTAGVDTLTGTAASDTINGLAGNDAISAGDGNDLVDGGEGNDTISGGTGADTLLGGLGDDHIINGNGPSSWPFSATMPYNQSGSDTIGDSINAGDGNDRVIIGLNDTADGGTGVDTIELDLISSSTSYTLDLSNPATIPALNTSLNISISNFEVMRFWLGSGNDSVTGSNQVDWLSGGVGNDTLSGGLGNDTVSGGTGADSLDGGDGDDQVIAGGVLSASYGFNLYAENFASDSSTDTLSGGNGNDTIMFGINDIVDGGAGNDFARMTLNEGIARNIDMSISLNAGLLAVTGANVTNVETLSLDLGSLNDTVLGSSANDSIFGNGGNDSLVGNGGNDTFHGVAGADTLSGGVGKDNLFGGAENDSLDGGDDADQLYGDAGTDTVIGGAGNDIVSGGSENDILDGGAGNDTLFGGTESDSMDGGADNDNVQGEAGLDTLFGGTGNDTLSGGADNDILDGGADNDFLTGDAGNDRLTGGAGADGFQFNVGSGNDTITDYTVGEDGFSFFAGAVTSFTNNLDLDADGQADDAVIVHGGGTVTLLNAVYSALDGTSNNDFFIGTTAGELIRGFNGDDNLTGGGGADTILGGNGNDFITTAIAQGSAAGNIADAVGDSVSGGAGNDNITTSEGSDTVFGDAGDDRIATLASSDIIGAGDGNDTITAGDGDDFISGGNGVDTFSFGAILEGTDTISDFNASEDALTFDGAVSSITSGLDLDADGQLDDTEVVHEGGIVKLMNASLSASVAGTTGNDTVQVGAINGFYFGLAGNDVITIDPSVVVNPITLVAGQVDGGAGNDSITGGALDDNLRGGAGNDTLVGGAGNDALGDSSGVTRFDGGDGVDRATMTDVNGASGQSFSLTANLDGSLTTNNGSQLISIEAITVFTGTGNDTISLANMSGLGIDPNLFLANFVFSGNGDDSVIGSAAGDTLQGDLGNDTIFGGAGNDYVIGGYDNDLVYGEDGDDRVSGDSGFVVENQPRFAAAVGGNDTIYGGAGNDTMQGFGGDDYIDGGDGFDRADYFNSAIGVNVSLAIVGAQNTNFGMDTLVDIEELIGSGNNDTLTGNAGDNILQGQGGINTMTGGLGRDVFHGNGSTSVIVNDYVTGTDRVEAGNQFFTLVTGVDADGDGQADDTVIRNGTIDRFRLLNVTATDVMGASGNDFYAGTNGIDAIYGQTGDDTITGGLGNDMLDGGAGNDILIGGAGADFLAGNGGNDTIGVEGDDLVDGGVGNDLVDFSAFGVGVSINALTTGNAQIIGGASVTLRNVENYTGTAFDDTLLGDGKINVLIGGNGADSLFGGASNDTLNGGVGADSIDGGFNNDLLTGGADADTFVFGALGGNDTITDFGATDSISFVGTTFTSVTNNIDLDADGQLDDATIVYAGGSITLLNASYTNVAVPTAGADSLSGTAGGDTIDGLSGNDTINGLGGDDSLTGGLGNDSLLGGLGNDTLTGGAGDDQLVGQGGDDLYVVGSVFGVVTEATGEGFDTINTSVSYVLAAGSEIEVLAAANVASTVAISLTGNEFDNQIRGAAGGDLLDGGAGGDDLYGFAGDDTLTGGTGSDTLRGGTGNDVYYVDDLNDRVVEAVGEGTDTVFTTGSFTISPSTHAEILAMVNSASTTSVALGGNGNDNQVLAAAGSDFIDGGAGNDTLYGFDGNDTMEGGIGDDILVGGGGNDNYYISAAGDVIIEAAGGGGDTAFTTVSYSLAAGAEVETLAAFNAASTTGLALNGNEFNNQILATAGNDTLNGVSGNDTLYGFGGSDVYYVDSASDVVVEAIGGGTDTVFSAGSYSLAFTSEVEVLAIANSAATAAFTLGGNEFANQLLAAAGNDSLDGDAGNDTLYAFAGNDTLNGGVGEDAMIGGAGNDTYYVDAALDSVQEGTGEGTDVVFTSVSFSATGSNEIEVIAASNAASVVGLALGGNAIANQLLATAGNDTLQGGAGVDTMYGFAGNDTYYVDNAGDVVIEAASGGTDTVFTDVSYTLTFGAEIEVIAASNSASTAGIGLVGNAFNNQLLGTAGGDTLNGGTGDDTLYGFGGNDIYYVDSTTDIVVEAASGGLDTIFTSGSYTLAGTSEVEILAASNAASTVGLVLGGNEFNNQVLATAGDDTLTGNAGNDTLYGFGGNDTLTGGLGSDFLVGGTGSDTFVLGEQFGGSTFDTITDYVVADDQIQLNLSAFATLTGGALAANAFVIGASATTADHRIIYDAVTGDLLYDGDGNGAGTASIFANIGTGLALTAGEFLVV